MYSGLWRGDLRGSHRHTDCSTGMDEVLLGEEISPIAGLAGAVRGMGAVRSIERSLQTQFSLYSSYGHLGHRHDAEDFTGQLH